MRATIEEVSGTRDIMHNLDPVKDRDLIKQKTEGFIVDGENFRSKVYLDTPLNPIQQIFHQDIHNK